MVTLRILFFSLLILLSVVYSSPVSLQVYSQSGDHVVYVPQDYETISEAIDNVPSGTTIIVTSGEYRESISIYSKYHLTIVGEGDVVIKPSGAPTYVISISSSLNIELKNIVINASDSVSHGIDVRDSDGIVFENITFDTDMNRGKCIEVFSSAGIVVRNSTFKGFVGLHLGGVNGAEIVDNKFVEVEKLLISSSVADVYVYLNTILEYNDITIYNTEGIQWYSPSKLVYRFNDTIHMNYMGNYWFDWLSRHERPDNDHDGICDTSFYTGYNYDDYPLRYPRRYYQILEPFIEIIEPTNYTFVSNDLYVELKIYVPEIKSTTLYLNDTVYSIGSSNAYMIDTSIFDDGFYKLLVKVVDQYDNKYLNHIFITIDNTPPNITMLNITSYSKDKLLVEWKVVEKHVDQQILYLNNSFLANVIGAEYILDTSKLDTGTYKLTLQIIDKAGHSINSSTYFEIQRQKINKTQATLSNTSTTTKTVLEDNWWYPYILIPIILIIATIVVIYVKKR